MAWSSFPDKLSRFAYETFHPDVDIDSGTDDSDIQDDEHKLEIHSHISVYHSATANFFMPSDISGVGGMRKEVIRAAPSWHRGPPRFDCVFVETDGQLDGFRGLHVARIKLFFSFKLQGHFVSCALVHWFESVGEGPRRGHRNVDSATRVPHHPRSCRRSKTKLGHHKLGLRPARLAHSHPCLWR